MFVAELRSVRRSHCRQDRQPGQALMSEVPLHLAEPGGLRAFAAPRARDSNKGDYGHVLVVGGAAGKTGAAEMAGLAALRAGAGLTTVASQARSFEAPELMAEMLPSHWTELEPLLTANVCSRSGPAREHGALGERLFATPCRNASSRWCRCRWAQRACGHEWEAGDRFRVLTPHPERCRG